MRVVDKYTDYITFPLQYFGKIIEQERINSRALDHIDDTTAKGGV